jgi:uridine kinase
MEQYQLNAVSSKIIDRILSFEKIDKKPLVIAIDGGSGSGKSSIAEIVAKQLNATLIVTDDFYAADITNEGWSNRSHRERATDAINWQSLRRNVLEPLINGMPAKWNSFDFNTGVRPDGTYGINSEFINYLPNDIIILEGAYSARPELSDLIHLKILIDVPITIRHRRLRKREENQFLIQWHKRWDEAELYYFRDVRPPSSFDMVIKNIKNN